LKSRSSSAASPTDIVGWASGRQLSSNADSGTNPAYRLIENIGSVVLRKRGATAVTSSGDT
jgi:hypothetical protein